MIISKQRGIYKNAGYNPETKRSSYFCDEKVFMEHFFFSYIQKQI